MSTATNTNPAGNPRIGHVNGNPENSATASEPGEFDRFQDLSRKLVNVPKSELDEKRKNESS
jgi:hypothetical protein